MAEARPEQPEGRREAPARPAARRRPAIPAGSRQASRRAGHSWPGPGRRRCRSTPPGRCSGRSKSQRQRRRVGLSLGNSAVITGKVMLSRVTYAWYQVNLRYGVPGTQGARMSRAAPPEAVPARHPRVAGPVPGRRAGPRAGTRPRAPPPPKVPPSWPARATRPAACTSGCSASTTATLWITPIRVEVLDLGTFAGGLKPVKEGGGLQTQSLRFAGADGREYSFRSINKDASKLLPPDLRGTLAARIAQDQISAAHPAGAAVAAPLAQAARSAAQRPEDWCCCPTTRAWASSGRTLPACSASSRSGPTKTRSPSLALRRRARNREHRRPVQDHRGKARESTSIRSSSSGRACSMCTWATGTGTGTSGAGPR